LEKLIPIVFNNMGVLQRQKKDFGTSIADFQEAIFRGSPYPYALAHYNQCITFYDRGLLDQSLSECIKASNLDPNMGFSPGSRPRSGQEELVSDPSGTLDLDYGLAARKLFRGNEAGSASEAIQLYKEAITLAPGYAHAHKNLGDAFWRSGDLNAARDEFRKAVEIDPGYRDAFHGFGLVLLEAKDFGKAVEELSIAVKLDGSIADFYTDLGCALERNGDLVRATSEYEEAIKIDSWDELPHLLTAKIFEQQPLPEAAEREYRAATFLSSDDVAREAHFRLGEMLLQSGRKADALRELLTITDDEKFGSKASLAAAQILIETLPGDENAKPYIDQLEKACSILTNRVGSGDDAGVLNLIGAVDGLFLRHGQCKPRQTQSGPPTQDIPVLDRPPSLGRPSVCQTTHEN
jgi:tetratricopeptide (TPR) repeat protein